MPIVTGFELDFDPLKTLRRLGRDPDRVFGARTSPLVYEQALEEARRLIHASYCYDVYPVLGAELGGLLIAQGQVLESPVVASLFREAPEVALLVYTVGPELETRVKELQQNGKHLSAFLLDR